MNVDLKQTIRVALLGAVAVSFAACASAPKPTPLGPPPPAPAPQPPMSQAPSAPVPGSVQDFVINVGDRVYFDFDQYQLRSDARPVLDSQASWLNHYPAVRVRIEGNCDERGTREYNLALGARRANSVRDYLVSRGISAARIETVSFGKERPVDGGSGEDAWAHNRNGHTAITAGAR